MRLGMGEVLIILVVVLLVFGPNKLPQLGDSLGKGIRSFKKAVEHDEPDQGTAAAVPPRQLEASASGGTQPVPGAHANKV